MMRRVLEAVLVGEITIADGRDQLRAIVQPTDNFPAVGIVLGSSLTYGEPEESLRRGIEQIEAAVAGLERGI